jgi:multiple sugar transport system permease protein
MTAQGSISPRLGIRHRMTPRKVWGNVAIYAVATLGALAFGLPFFWTAASSLKTQSEIYTFPPAWLPAAPIWKNYALVFQLAPFGPFILNTAFITVLSMIGQIVSASVVAFGFTRFRFPWRDQIFFLVLATMMIPWQVTLVPTFLLFRIIGWINTYKPLIVPNYFRRRRLFHLSAAPVLYDHPQGL